MDIFSDQGFTEFVLAQGHGALEVKDYFRDFPSRRHDLTARLDSGETQLHAQGTPPWTVRLVDTGPDTASGGRLRRLGACVNNEERFFLTYCDGLADVDLQALFRFHTAHGKLVTMTAVHPPPRFGLVGWNGDAVTDFREKPPNCKEWINGGFFVVERSTLDLIRSDDTSWERDMLHELAAQGELMGFRHEGFFAAVDTPKDRDAMEELCALVAPPWRQRCTSCAY
jgi:glucose-1-phosphate cytidylyltransferase